MKKIAVILVLTLLCFAGCDSDLSGVSGVDKTTKNRISTAIITTWDNTIDTVRFTDMEYSPILDNGFGFAFDLNGKFQKSYLTENIQSIIISNE